MLAKMTLASAILLGACVMFAPVSAAHSWYPRSCCSDQDCEMVPASGIEQVSQGYHVRYVSPIFGEINEEVPSTYVRGSQDMNYHACWKKTTLFPPRIICFFAPLNV